MIVLQEKITDAHKGASYKRSTAGTIYALLKLQFTTVMSNRSQEVTPFSNDL